jgi:uncharacterized Fe-S cluster-containing protein
MKKTNKNLITIFIIGVITLSVYYFIFSNISVREDIFQVSNQNVNKVELALKDDINNTSNKAEDEDTRENIESKSLEIKEDKVFLFVLDKKYEADFIEDESVFNLMNRLKGNGSGFYFDYKDYKSLGAFITNIDNVSKKDNEYFIYYINDKKAEVGVSNYNLKKGDIIKWVLE